MRKRIGVRNSVGLALAAGLLVAVVLGVPAALGAYTTIDPTVDPGVLCLNGNPLVNCNIYTGKQFVWMNGGPLSASLGPGTYFFAVMVPGTQSQPNDGESGGNLSFVFDSYLNRTFTVAADGTVSYTGNGPGETPHDFDSAAGKIRLAPYDNTTNNGGVYIMDVCRTDNLGAAYDPVSNPVSSDNCKKDAFK